MLEAMIDKRFPTDTLFMVFEEDFRFEEPEEEKQERLAREAAEPSAAALRSSIFAPSSHFFRSTTVPKAKMVAAASADERREMWERKDTSIWDQSCFLCLSTKLRNDV